MYLCKSMSQKSIIIFAYQSYKCHHSYELHISDREDAQNPQFWSRVCLRNIAKLAKEATTMRHVLESFFRYFDNGNLWSPKLGLGLSVLLDMQLMMENLGIIFL